MHWSNDGPNRPPSCWPSPVPNAISEVWWGPIGSRMIGAAAVSTCGPKLTFARAGLRMRWKACDRTGLGSPGETTWAVPAPTSDSWSLCQRAPVFTASHGCDEEEDPWRPSGAQASWQSKPSRRVATFARQTSKRCCASRVDRVWQQAALAIGYTTFGGESRVLPSVNQCTKKPGLLAEPRQRVAGRVLEVLLRTAGCTARRSNGPDPASDQWSRTS